MSRARGRPVRRSVPACTVLVVLLGASACKDGATTYGSRPGATGPTGSTTSPAAVEPCADPSPRDVAGDLNHDLAADFAVGDPKHGDVLVTFYGNGTQRLTEETLDPASTPAAVDAFGSAVAVGEVMGADTCSDLVIGAPGRGGSGAVFVAPGHSTTADGRTIGPGVQVISGSASGDRFGAAVAIGGGHLWVGAPGRAVDGVVGAGAVYEYALTGPAPRLVATITQATPSVGATPAAGDGFGSVLAASAHGVLIGTPGDDVGPDGQTRDAGSVTFYADPSSAGRYTTHTWTEAVPAIGASAQAGAAFGASVAASPDGRVMAAGAPGRDLGSLRDAGQVVTFVAVDNGYRPRSRISQDSPGVPGTAEAGDGFGAALAVGAELLCRGSTDLAVGSPGEDIEGDQDAGSVTLVSVVGRTCAAQALQGPYRRGGLGFGVLSHLAGAGDRMGTALGVRRHAATDRPERDSLLIGVPGLDIHGGGVPDRYQAIAPVLDCGVVVVQTLAGSFNGPSVGRLVFDGPTDGIRYGGVISAAAS